MAAEAIRNRYQVVEEVEHWSDNEFLQDRREEYEPLYTPEEHITIGEPTEREALINKAQERLIPFCTYDSPN